MGEEGRVGCKTKKRHRFFKVFFPGLNSKQLEISPAFRRHIHCTRPASTCFLTGPSKNIWRVGMIKNEKGVFFRDGWEEFVRDHSLQTGEFLVFEYQGGSRFRVLIFDASMCEKEDAFDVSSSRVLDAAEGSKPRGKVKEEPFSATQKHECGCCPPWKGDSSPKAKRKPLKKHYMGVWISQRRPITKVEIDRAHHEAFSFKSIHPFLVQVMRKYDVYFGHTMSVPLSFSRRHLPTNRKMTLWDPTGKPWTVNYITCTGQCFFSGGWRKFALANFLEQGDACVFELIKADEIHVHIFRVVDETKPLIRKVGF
uniref:B3 domain-containing protein Os11g0197600 n=1 Tax=Anthurium amnicola TaxID=1678845 RepID=A0A1D1YTV3_9ARAE